jgi:UDP-glucose 4-epimerase
MGLKKSLLMNDVLVTGGAGFVGSHLCERLVSMGCSVTSLDNYYTGSTENHVESVRYVEANTMDISDVLSNERFDTIFHLGEYSRVEQSFLDIDTVWEYNIHGTREVLNYALRYNSKLIYAGSSTKFAHSDDYVESPYAWTKRTNTELIKNYGLWYSLNYAITYFYNVYGPREIKEGKYATLIAKYKNLKSRNEPLPIVLPGTQRRNFTHVDDIVDGLILVGLNGSGDEYGIGSDESFSIIEVAEMFDSQITFLEPRLGNRMSGDVITDKTKSLGWYPKRKLVNWIHNKY